MTRKKAADFDALLRVRRRQEEVHAQSLASTRRGIQASKRARAELADYQRDILQRRKDIARACFDASEALRYQQYERHLARVADTVDAEIRMLEDEAEVKRRDLEAAMQRRRMVEKLWEKRMQEQLARLRKLEQQLSDDMACAYAARDRLVEPEASGP